MRNLAWLALALSVPACNTDYAAGYGVAVIITADSSISDATLANIRVLNLEVSGAESDIVSLGSSAPFGSGREQRVIYRPGVSSGMLNMAALATDNTGVPVGYGMTAVTLKAGATVTANITLSAGGIPAQPDLGFPGGPTVTPNPATVNRNTSQTFTADSTVTWTVKEASGGTIDASGHYTAPGEPGIYTVVAARTDFPEVKTEVPVKVGYAGSSIIAGAPGGYGSLDDTGDQARLNYGQAAPAIDSFGNLYVVDQAIIRKIDTNGKVTTIAGQPFSNYYSNIIVDGTGSAARFASLTGIAIDSSATNLYVTECQSVVRRINIATGTVVTIAGKANQSGLPNGMTGASARFNCPNGLAFQNNFAGGILYVADTSNNAIQTINLSDFSTAVVAGASDGSNDCASASYTGKLCNPHSIAFDSANNSAYYVDSGSGAGFSGRVFSYNGASALVATNANYLTGIAVDSSSVLWLTTELSTNPYNMVLESMAENGTNLTTIAGQGGAGYLDGNGATAKFSSANGAVAATATDLYYFDGGNYVIRKISKTSPYPVTTFAGKPQQNGFVSSNGNDGSTARFSYITSLAADTAGTVYVADSGNHAIRKLAIDASNHTTVTTLAGGAYSSTPDPTPVDGASAHFAYPNCVKYVAPNTLYVCDQSAIRKIDLSTANATTSLVNNFVPPYSPINYYIQDIAFDNAGTLYVLSNSAILKFNPERQALDTYAGSQNLAGMQNGRREGALFQYPNTLTFDGNHALYVADTSNNLIRKVDLQTEMVSTVGGQASTVEGSADGPLGTNQVWFPAGVTFHNGHVWITDTVNGTIRVLDPTSGIMSTFAGVVLQHGLRPGPLNQAALNFPSALAFRPNGNLVVNSQNEAAIALFQ